MTDVRRQDLDRMRTRLSSKLVTEWSFEAFGIRTEPWE